MTDFQNSSARILATHGDTLTVHAGHLHYFLVEQQEA